MIYKDDSFDYWKSKFPNTSRAILVISFLFSFKFIRMYYSRFLGLDNFCCGYMNSDSFLRPINLVSAANFIF